jgi:hypothetical protein
MRDFIRKNGIYDIRNPRTYDKKGVIKIVSFEEEEDDDEFYNLVIEDMEVGETLDVTGYYRNGYFYIITPYRYILSNFNQSIKKPRSRTRRNSRSTKTRHGGNPNKNRKSKK